MSTRVSSWVWHDVQSDVMGNELVLMLALADVANDDGLVTFATPGAMTYEALAVKARVSRSTIIRMVAKLRDRGLLMHEPGSKGSENRFALCVPWAKISGVNLEPNGSDAVSTATLFGVNSDSHPSYRRSNVVARSEGKPKAHHLPEGWAPTEEHRQRCIELGVDVEREAESFRLHAEANARKAVVWNAAFTQWIVKARPTLIPGGAPAVSAAPSDSWLDALR